MFADPHQYFLGEPWLGEPRLLFPLQSKWRWMWRVSGEHVILSQPITAFHPPGHNDWLADGPSQMSRKRMRTGSLWFGGGVGVGDYPESTPESRAQLERRGVRHQGPRALCKALDPSMPGVCRFFSLGTLPAHVFVIQFEGYCSHLLLKGTWLVLILPAQVEECLTQLCKW